MPPTITVGSTLFIPYLPRQIQTSSPFQILDSGTISKPQRPPRFSATSSITTTRYPSISRSCTRPAVASITERISITRTPWLCIRSTSAIWTSTASPTSDVRAIRAVIHPPCSQCANGPSLYGNQPGRAVCRSSGPCSSATTRCTPARRSSLPHLAANSWWPGGPC